MTSELWYPLLALIERGDHAALAQAMSGRPSSASVPESTPAHRPPPPALRDAVLRLREVLRQEYGQAGQGQQFWLLLDTSEASPEIAFSPLEIGRVLDELREKFQQHRLASQTQAVPDFEAFLREKMNSLGFDDLGSAPLLPDLQREALRGLGVGLGSQMAQMLGRMAGWHGDAKPPRDKPQEAEKPAGKEVRLLRLELGPELCSDRAFTTTLRQEIGKIRRKAGQRLGWELSPLQLSPARDLRGRAWRLLLRGEEVAEADSESGLLAQLESVFSRHADALFPFAEFEAMLRQPGCKLVAKEMRQLGLEKALLWTVCRRILAAGGHLREPLTVLERILEASITSHEMSFLVDTVLEHGSPAQPDS